MRCVFKSRRKTKFTSRRLSMKLNLLTVLTATKVAAGFGVLALTATLSPPHLSLAADIKVLDTRLKGGVSSPNAAVMSPDNVLKGFTLDVIVEGIDPLENPSGVITKFGFLSNGTLTEPDENTYLVLDHNPGGPTPGYDYGRHFLFQGHENSSELAYITRINLDVPRGSPHRITLLTPVNPATGNTGFGSIDGSTYNPSTNTMLFTQEAGTAGGVIQVTVDWPSQVNTLDAFLGKAGYEGIHPDKDGNIYIIEDAGGTTSHTPAINNARQPNSFVYRF